MVAPINPNGAPPNPPLGIEHGGRPVNEAPKDKPAEVPASAESTRVIFTPEADQLRNALNTTPESTEPEFDAARVAEIKAQLDGGSFESDPKQIADKLIAFDALLPTPDPTTLR